MPSNRFLDALNRLPYALYKPLALLLGVLAAPVVALLALLSEPHVKGARLSILDLLSAARRLGAWGQLGVSQVFLLRSPYTADLDPIFEEAECGHFRVALHQRWRLQNPFRTVHALALGNLAEMAAMMCALTRVEEHSRFSRAIPVRIDCRYHKRAQGKIVAEARMARIEGAEGSREETVRVALSNEQGEEIAEVHVTMALSLSLAPRKRD
jgi:acyl-coenzyme A thioesterase PaaI-like protein